MSSVGPPSEGDSGDIDKGAGLLDASTMGLGISQGGVYGGGQVIAVAAAALADDHCIALGAKQEGADRLEKLFHFALIYLLSFSGAGFPSFPSVPSIPGVLSAFGISGIAVSYGFEF